MTRLIISMLALVALLSSCSGNEHSHYRNLPPYGWLYGDTVSYDPARIDSLPFDADIAIAIRHTNAYTYNNIWLEMQWADSCSVHTDTLNIRLANEYGTWFGNGVGVAFQYTDTVRPNITINPHEPIRLRHIMRIDTLSDIEQVGIIVYKH